MNKIVLSIIILLSQIIYSCKDKHENYYYEFKILGVYYTQYYVFNNNDFTTYLYSKENIIIDSNTVKLTNTELHRIKFKIDSIKTCPNDIKKMYDITVKAKNNDSIKPVCISSLRMCFDFLQELDCNYHLSNDIVKRLQKTSRAYLRNGNYEKAYEIAEIAMQRTAIVYFDGYTNDYTYLPFMYNYKENLSKQLVEKMINLSTQEIKDCKYVIHN